MTAFPYKDQRFLFCDLFRFKKIEGGFLTGQGDNNLLRVVAVF